MMEADEIFKIRKQIYLGHSQNNEIDLGLRIYELEIFKEANEADERFKEWKENYIRQQRETAESERLMDDK